MLLNPSENERTFSVEQMQSILLKQKAKIGSLPFLNLQDVLRGDDDAQSLVETLQSKRQSY